jgi:hypothetical protein
MINSPYCRRTCGRFPCPPVPISRAFEDDEGYADDEEIPPMDYEDYEGKEEL